MKPSLIAASTKHIEAVLEAYKQALAHSQTLYPDSLEEIDALKINTMVAAAVARISGNSSSYSKMADNINARVWDDEVKTKSLIGVIEALKADLAGGFLTSIEEDIHAELFGDFLEMAEYILSEDLKDPAAAIAGGALEAHLRQLCKKFKIETEVVSSEGVRSKKADQMNADLARDGCISKLDQKSITSWLDLRNKAAHGKFEEYEKGQVRLMIAGIRDWIIRNPA